MHSVINGKGHKSYPLGDDIPQTVNQNSTAFFFRSDFLKNVPVRIFFSSSCKPIYCSYSGSFSQTSEVQLIKLQQGSTDPPA